MTANSFLIGTEEAAAMAAGTPAIVVDPAVEGLDALALLVLRPSQGVLRRDDRSAGPAIPLAPGLRPLAIAADDAEAAGLLAASLPAGVPQVIGPDPLPSLLSWLASALAESQAARLLLHGRPGNRPPPERETVLELRPVTAALPPPPRVTQHLGRPAEGLCAVALHVAASRATAASLLRVRLLAGGRILGAWLLPGDVVEEGWLTLDLPEPAPAGAAEAVLEVAVEVAPEEVLQLSTTGSGPDAALALRAERAAPGHLVLPLHFDWASRDLPLPAPGAALPLPEQAWAAVRVEGATHRLVAAGAEAARLVLELAPGARALVSLPAVPPGAAELALGEFACRLGDPAGLQLALLAGPAPPGQAGADGTSRHSGWRIPDAGGTLRVALPLPPGLLGAVHLGLLLQNRGAAPLTLEVSTLALMTGAAGVRRRVASFAGAASFAGVASGDHPRPQTQAAALVLPGSGVATPDPPALVRATTRPGMPGPPLRTAPPAPPLAIAEAGGPVERPAPEPVVMMPAAPAVSASAELPPGGAEFQDIRLHQHTTNADGSYQHLELGLSGLVAPTGLWREVRLKLFDRRGTVGLEFRRIKGWPPMFDAWPQGGSDQFGAYWRLETQDTADAMAKLTAPHDRALVAALLEVLPTLASRGARIAGLPAEAQDAWSGRAQALAAATDATRPGRIRPAAQAG
jgi:hypothetical protein